MRRALVLLLLAGCPAPPVPPAPPPGAASCADVCQHYALLGCEAARPTAHGTSCTAVCQNVIDSAVVPWDRDCRARAASCAEAEACERR